MPKPSRAALGAAFFIALPVLAATPAPAERLPPPCGRYAALVETLRRQHGEVPIWRGLTHGGTAIVELLVNPDGGSWTAIRVDTAGEACLTGAGTDWLSLDIGRGEPS